ncbi:MAG: hypothetical protein Q8S57_06610 [Methanoregula sp.]|nr:hypothetical protein [Methanoregula sp.]
MAVNQSQVDHIITAASEDDPEVKLQNLEREVDLIKTSIKRLLMDIRERMNELENPFTLTAVAGGSSGHSISAAEVEAGEAKRSALEAREAALDARESQIESTKSKNETEKYKAESAKEAERSHSPVTQYEAERKMLDEQMLAALRNQMTGPPMASPPGYHPASQPSYLPAGFPSNSPASQPARTAMPPPSIPINEKLRLQKVYKLFKWTTQSVKKFGHDRLEIILGSYQAMGYISKDSCDEIREISRLMPANLGEEHEVGPDEFVAELYALNRILSPTDTSLDRDMIEVMMEQRQQDLPVKEKSSEPKLNISGISMRERSSPSKSKENDEDWMNLPDRI